MSPTTAPRHGAPLTFYPGHLACPPCYRSLGMVILRDILRDIVFAVVFAVGAVTAADFMMRVWDSLGAP